VQLALQNAAVATSDAKSTQLVRVSYKRPETWRFMVAAEIVASNLGIGSVANVFIDWQLTIGVGRSQITIPKWISMIMPLNGTSADLRQTWCNSATLPPLDPTTPDPTPRICDSLVAQDIQLTAVANLASLVPVIVGLKLDAYFAPNAHVRPDWYKGAFNGQELNGQ
jgi:hypothetical protein